MDIQGVHWCALFNVESKLKYVQARVNANANANAKPRKYVVR